MIFVGNVWDLQELQKWTLGKWTCKNVTTKESCCKLKRHLFTLTNAIIGVIFPSMEKPFWVISLKKWLEGIRKMTSQSDFPKSLGKLMWHFLRWCHKSGKWINVQTQWIEKIPDIYNINLSQLQTNFHRAKSSSSQVWSVGSFKILRWWLRQLWFRRVGSCN